MIGMGFGTCLLFSGEIKTEIFSASMAELKEVLIKNCITDFTAMNLHTLRS